MIRRKLKIASDEFTQVLHQKVEDSQPLDRVSLSFDAVLAQLQELVTVLSDRVERGEAIIDKLMAQFEEMGLDVGEDADDEDTDVDASLDEDETNLDDEGGDDRGRGFGGVSAPRGSLGDDGEDEDYIEPDEDTYDA